MPVPCLVAAIPEPERSVVVFSPVKPFGTVRCDPPFEMCFTASDAGVLERYLGALQRWAKDTELACAKQASSDDGDSLPAHAHEAEHVSP